LGHERAHAHLSGGSADGLVILNRPGSRATLVAMASLIPRSTLTGRGWTWRGRSLA